MVEINKNYDQGPGRNSRQEVIQERDEILEDTQNYGIPSLANLNHGGFAEGLETQVNQELLQHQMAGMNYKKAPVGKKYPGGGFQNKQQQREWEEAMELDQILEEERRLQSMQAFQQASENKFDNYMT